MLQQELKDKNLATNLRQFLNNFVVDVTLQSSDVINVQTIIFLEFSQLCLSMARLNAIAASAYDTSPA
jgi:hypothetical protein